MARTTSIIMVEIKRRTSAWENKVWCFSLFIARQHTDARYWYSNSVRLSVCLLSVCCDR